MLAAVGVLEAELAVEVHEVRLHAAHPAAEVVVAFYPFRELCHLAADRPEVGPLAVRDFRERPHEHALARMAFEDPVRLELLHRPPDGRDGQAGHLAQVGRGWYLLPDWPVPGRDLVPDQAHHLPVVRSDGAGQAEAPSLHSPAM